MGKALILLIGVPVFIAAMSDGELGAAVVVVVVVLLLLLMGSVERRDTKAWNNRQNYWAYGKEPDWKRKGRPKKED